MRRPAQTRPPARRVDAIVGKPSSFLVTRTLSGAVRHAMEQFSSDELRGSGWDERLLAPFLEPPAQNGPVHPAAPPVGAESAMAFTVRVEGTAAAMGHPDGSMDVLGSPQIALWFELATNSLMPAAENGVRHVGVGILVHHTGRADLGEQVVVHTRVEEVLGRTVLFSFRAEVGDRVVALGTHQRVIHRPAADPTAA